MNDLDARAVFTPYLAPRETIRWSGRPQQGLALRPTDAFTIPFSLLWCGFAIFWEWGVWQSGGPSFFTIWGGAFVLIGLYLVFGRFIHDALLRGRTYYALTDERALILSGLFNRELTSIDLKTTSEIRYADHGSSGTIGFGASTTPFRSGAVWTSSPKTSPEFFRTPDADSAYRLIQSAKRKSEAPA